MYKFVKNNHLFPCHIINYRRNRDFYDVFAEDKKIASFYITIHEHECDFEITYLDYSDMYELFNRIYQFIINRYRFEKVIYKGNKKEVRHILLQLAFYPKGKILQRVTDPYRLLCKKNTFNEEGLIIKQDNTDVIPFGLFNSKDKGCGWIAAYNLLQINHFNPEIYDVTSNLSKDDLFFSAFGESVFSLYAYLKKKLDVRFASLPEKLLVKKINDSREGILLYYHKRGAHFTMYRKVNENEFEFINAIYGKKIILSAEAFMKKYTIMHFATIIYR